MIRAPSGRKNKKKVKPLNLIPILDSVFIFIFFLLMSANFVEFFEIQSNEYKKNILDEESLIVTIEAGETSNWKKYLRANGISFGIDRFGESAPFKEIFNSLNLSEDKIVSEIQNRLRSQ